MLKRLFYFISAIFVLGGIWLFSSKRKHLLAILLRLEFIILSIYFIIFMWLCLFNKDLYFLILFLVMIVCEGALGLSILISLIRTHGNDYFQSFRVLQC